MLLIWGMQDVAFSHRVPRPSNDHCDDGKLVFFEDATHWVQYDATDEVNNLLIEFLA